MTASPAPSCELPPTGGPPRLVDLLAQDLKSHLDAMRRSAQSLTERAAALQDPQLERTADQIFQASAQMTAFVAEFLSRTTPDLPLAIKTEALDLAAMAADSVRSFQETARRKEIVLEFAGGAVPVLADRAALDHALRNLISNALKFSAPGRRVWVSVQSGPQTGECRVRDEGPGLSAADQAQLFQPYGRLSAQPTAGESSTGLGLSIVKKLVDSMQGTLRCESTLGAGATFVLTLPGGNARAVS